MPIGTNRRMFKTVSTGPLTMSTSGMRDMFGEKVPLMHIPVSVNMARRYKQKTLDAMI